MAEERKHAMDIMDAVVCGDVEGIKSALRKRGGSSLTK
jgi:hypothetical protein